MKCPFCGETVRSGETHCPDCGIAMPRREPERPVRSFEQLRGLSKRAFWKEFAPKNLYLEVESSLYAPLILASVIPAVGLIRHRSVHPLVFLALAAAAAVLGLGVWRRMSRACAAGLALCAAGYLLICHFCGGGVFSREWSILIPGLYPLLIQWELHTAYERFQRKLAQRQNTSKTR